MLSMPPKVNIEIEKGKETLQLPNIELDIPYAPNGLKDLFLAEKTVRDAHRGLIKVSDSGLVSYKENDCRDECFASSDFMDRIPKSVLPSVVLVLESPHRYEYSGSGTNITPKGPAQGQKPGCAGTAIKRHIAEVVKKSGFSLKGAYALVISNPVQYPASLFSLLKDKKIRG